MKSNHAQQLTESGGKLYLNDSFVIVNNQKESFISEKSKPMDSPASEATAGVTPVHEAHGRNDHR